MPLSAEFSVEGDSSVTAHEVNYGDTVDLALVSDNGVNVVSWSIQGTSHESFTAPTITPAGSPSGKTASFAMPADPGGGEGRSVLVKCTVTDSALNQAVAYRVVGVANDAGTIPIAAGEENHRSSTHGWIGPVNAALAGVTPGSGGVTVDPLNIYYQPDADPGGDGRRTAPFDTFSDAQTALTAGGRIILRPADYSAVDLSITKNMTLATEVPVGRFVAGLTPFVEPVVVFDDITIAASTSVKFSGVGCDTLALGEAAQVELRDGSQTVAITNAAGEALVGIFDSRVNGDIAANRVWGDNAEIGSEAITCSGTDQYVKLTRSMFSDPSPTITFTGDPGNLEVDDYTNYWWEGTTETLTNGTKTIISDDGGVGGGVTLPIDAAHGDVILRGEIDAGGADAPLLRWGVDATDALTVGSDSGDAANEIYNRALGAHKWYVNTTLRATLDDDGLSLGANNLLTTGNIQIGATVAASGDIRGHNTLVVAARNNANNADVDLLQKTSADLVIIGDSTDASGVEFKTKTGSVFTWDIAGTDEVTLSATTLALGSNNVTLTGNIQQGSSVATTGDYRVGASWSLIGLNETLSSDRDVLTYNTGTVTLGGSTADTSVVRGTSSAIININGTARLSFDSTSADFGTTVIKQGSTPSSTGDLRTKSAWVLAARNNANNADVDLLQKTSADLVIIGDSTDASGVEIKAKTATTVIIDIAGTDEHEFTATAYDAKSNNILTTGNIQIGSGATSASSGSLRLSDNATVTWYDGSTTRTALTLSGSGATWGSTTSLTRYNSFDVHQFSIGSTSRWVLAGNELRHDTSGAATWYLIGLATTGTGNALTIAGEDRTASTSTNTGGAVTLRGGNATGATATHTGGKLTLQGGDATGGSGTRTGGGLDIRAGTGASANGELRLLDNTTPRIRIDGTGLAFYNTAPIAKPTVSGAKGANAALGSLMTALSNLGLVTDSTSA